MNAINLRLKKRQSPVMQQGMVQASLMFDVNLNADEWATGVRGSLP